MENSIPRTPEAVEAAEESGCRSLDDTIEHCLGDFCWTQIFQATLISFAWFFDAQQTFISVFTDAEPKFYCTHGNSCNVKNLCQLPRDAWSWKFPATTSTISEWSLQCDGSIITGLPASSFFLGCLIGGFLLATLSDSGLGRKNMLVLSCLTMSLTGLVSALSVNVWMYAALRFISGIGRSTVGSSGLVLATELVRKKWREGVGIAGFVLFTMGFISLPMIAFLVRDSSWRLIYLLTCGPSTVYSISLYFLAGESPRWLFIKGKKKEFAETLISLASPAKRRSLDENFFTSCNQKDLKSDQGGGGFYCLKLLVKTGWSRRRLAAVIVVGFGTGVIYYGMPLALGNMSIDLYLSVTLNALLEFPACLLTYFLISKLNRKGSVLGLAVVSGSSSISCVIMKWKTMQVALELLSFFTACAAVDVALIYTLELFPTCVRNSAVSMVRQFMALGGVMGAAVVAAERRHGMMAYGVFGATMLVCGVFSLCLPETRGRILTDTMEDEDKQNPCT